MGANRGTLGGGGRDRSPSSQQFLSPSAPEEALRAQMELSKIRRPLQHELSYSNSILMCIHIYTCYMRRA